MHLPTLLKIENLNFKYNSNVVLKNINLEINQGEYIGLIGPNGGGKTTLIKLILGLIKPETGYIYFEDKLLNNTQNATKIGYVAQKYAESVITFPATVEEIVQSGLKLNLKPWQKLSKNQSYLLDTAMEISDIKEFKNKLITELSGGQRQRVFLARSLASQPKILILDEPTVGVDTYNSSRFYEFLKHLNKDHKITIILVSHELAVVAKQATRVICLNQTILEDASSNLTDENFISTLYGKDFKLVKHHHHDS